ncbi:hypothetical protein U4E84_09595 [Halorubrum sp. AD140]|uniref:hypothetical protein n=1 Tax=Halorubrum sp. AD140 TaxID=3050073 RepID=UPI002ACC7263|nr:hypothetical protein [Halorubrum sp. AD140]MDZ5811596.1 hypothetical protein [Halorubrum sp. AD140]
MTRWDPDGIVVGDAFRSYVEDLRETYDHAAGGVQPDSQNNMSETQSGSDAQADEPRIDVDSQVSRRVFIAGVGAAAATAAGAGTAAAQEDGDQIPDFDSEYTPVLKLVDVELSVEEHTSDMGELDYVNNDGEVKSLTDEFGAVLEPEPDDEEETHNPVRFNARDIDSDEYRAFPRDATRTNSDDEEEDVSALDADEWSTDEADTDGSITVEDDDDALSVSTSDQGSGDVATATFSLTDLDSEIDSGEERKMLQLVLDVDDLEADAVVSFDVVDSNGESVTATIDADADSADDDVIATEQGSGIVFQTQLGEFDGGEDLDTLEEIVVEVEEANAELTIHGMNLELDSEWSFGTRETFDEDEEEVVEETLVEPSGRTGIVSLESLLEEWGDATIAEVEYHVEVRASESPRSHWQVETEEIERGDYDLRYTMVGGLELPGGLYDVEVSEPGELVDEVRHPEDAYDTVEYAHDLGEIPTLDDIDDTDWTDATSEFDADMDEEVTVSSTVESGDRIGVHYVITEDEDIIEPMVTSTGGGGGAPALGGGGGGIMSNLWAWAVALGTGAVGAIALARRRAANAVGGD